MFASTQQSPFKDVGVDANSLTGNYNGMVNCLFLVNTRCIRKGFLDVSSDKNPEDSNMARVEANHLSVGHDTCY
jgi:hypothetical protein